MTTDQRAAELREALRRFENAPVRLPVDERMIFAAARERLAQLEGKALVIEKVDGEWPEWALVPTYFIDMNGGGDPSIVPLKATAHLDALAAAQMHLVPLPDRGGE